MKQPKYASLADYCNRNDVRKVWLAKQLGFSRFRFSAALAPDLYPISLTDDEIARIASLLNQSESYVRSLYTKKGAA